VRLLDSGRPSTDAALWLGVTRVMIDNKWYDEAFVKQFTDFPILIRTDNLKRPARGGSVSRITRSALCADGPSKKVQGLTDEQHKKLGDFVVWDAKDEFSRGAAPRLLGRSSPKPALIRRSTSAAK
jgi:nitrate reductase alpha subunit